MDGALYEIVGPYHGGTPSPIVMFGWNSRVAGSIQNLVKINHFCFLQHETLSFRSQNVSECRKQNTYINSSSIIMESYYTIEIEFHDN